ncbi:MAG: hypothetical protein ACYT04_97400, partial [Nostoc sp.]
ESVQREAMPESEEELQMKSLADSIQRVEIDDEEELQMKTQVQRREAIADLVVRRRRHRLIL